MLIMKRFLMGIIENRKQPLSELIDIIGTEDMEPVKTNIHLAHGVHVQMFRSDKDEYLGVYQVPMGFTHLDLECGIITNGYYENE